MDVVAKGRYLPTLKELVSISFTFGLTVLAWIFFRAENLGHAIAYISEIFSPSLFAIPNIRNFTLAIPTILFTIFLVLIEWNGRDAQHAIESKM